MLLDLLSLISTLDKASLDLYVLKAGTWVLFCALFFPCLPSPALQYDRITYFGCFRTQIILAKSFFKLYQSSDQSILLPLSILPGRTRRLQFLSLWLNEQCWEAS